MVYVLPSSLINKTLTRFTDQLVLNSHHNSLPHAVHRCSCRPQFVLMRQTPVSSPLVGIEEVKRKVGRQPWK